MLTNLREIIKSFNQRQGRYRWERLFRGAHPHVNFLRWSFFRAQDLRLLHKFPIGITILAREAISRCRINRE